MRVFIKGYGPKFAYVKGPENIIAHFSSEPPSRMRRKKSPGRHGPAHTHDVNELQYLDFTDL